MDTSASSTVSDIDNQTFFLRPPRREVLKVAILGAVLGLVIPVVSFLIERFLIEPVFCKSPDTFGVCASGGLTAFYVATALFSAAAIAVMAHWRVFRPVLIAAGVAAALWGLKRYMGELSVDSVVEYYLYSAALFSISYLLFYWLMRIRVFTISVIATVLCVVIIRWAVIG